MNSAHFTLYLVRHAQSANNANPESQRIPDPGLTPLGVQQAQALAPAICELAPTDLYSSPFLRTLQTTAPLAQTLNATPYVRADLFEQGGCYRGYRIGDRTPQPGLGRSAIESLHPTWKIDPAIDESGWNKLTEYESLAQARQRARSVCDWLSNHPWPNESRVMLVIHADFKIRLIEALLDSIQIQDSLESVVNTAWTQLHFAKGSWTLENYNVHEHLTPSMITC